MLFVFEWEFLQFYLHSCCYPLIPSIFFLSIFLTMFSFIVLKLVFIFPCIITLTTLICLFSIIALFKPLFRPPPPFPHFIGISVRRMKLNRATSYSSSFSLIWVVNTLMIVSFSASSAFTPLTSLYTSSRILLQVFP